MRPEVKWEKENGAGLLKVLELGFEHGTPVLRNATVAHKAIGADIK